MEVHRKGIKKIIRWNKGGKPAKSFLYKIEAMAIRIFEISDKVHEWDRDKLELNETDADKLYLVDITTTSRSEVIQILEMYPIHEEILEDLQTPQENLRFQVIRNQTYGELAFFNEKSESPLAYLGVIGMDNFLFLIHETHNNISKDVLKGVSESVEVRNSGINLEFILYVVVLEMLTYYGQLIIKYKSQIEGITLDPDEFDPKIFMIKRKHLESFSSVFEKMYFTLNFPPGNDLAKSDNSYSVYFNDLLKTLETLQRSLDRTEAQLDSVYEHHQLLIQDKTNKRINLLTIIQVIFIPMTLLTGIYGMNFKNMPELNSQNGYFIVLGAILAMGTGSLLVLKIRGWFD